MLKPSDVGAKFAFGAVCVNFLRERVVLARVYSQSMLLCLRIDTLLSGAAASRGQVFRGPISRCFDKETTC